MNWYKKAFEITPNTKFNFSAEMTVGEFLALDDWFDYGRNSKTTRDIVLRILKQHPELIRMHTEGQI